MSDATSSHALVRPFDFGQRRVRALLIDGEVWFVLRDLLAVLGLGNVTEVLRSLDGDEFSTTEVVDSVGRSQSSYVVNEAGMYSLIMRSRKPDAKTFKRWVTHEVLPEIRRTGSYVPEPRYEIPGSYAEALELAARKVREVEDLQQRNAELAPAAEAWDVLASAEGDYSVGDAAKMLSRDPAIVIGQNRLFQFMRDLGWTFRRGESWRAYQSQVDAGRLVERAGDPYRHPRTGEMTLPDPQVRVTAKGLMALRRELTGMNQLPLPG